MTILVGIRCKDGVVIGADSSVTFGTHRQHTIEQDTDKKIEIISDEVIVAGTGYVGHQQRVVNVVSGLMGKQDFFARNRIEIAKAIAGACTNDFGSTNAQMGRYGALVAYRSTDYPYNLCEFAMDDFQPEMKEANGNWWVSIGSGQAIVDPFLALLKQVFWKNGPPSLRGGIFTALWALQHACELNTGGIKDPIHIATLARVGQGKAVARKLEPDALAEHKNMIVEATAALGKFRDVLEGTANAVAIPAPPPPQRLPHDGAKHGSGILPGLPGGKPSR